jgi:hypothetical protein
MQQEYSKLKVAELRGLLEQQGVAMPSNASRVQLIQKVQSATPKVPPAASPSSAPAPSSPSLARAPQASSPVTRFVVVMSASFPCSPCRSVYLRGLIQTPTLLSDLFVE